VAVLHVGIAVASVALSKEHALQRSKASPDIAAEL
jgi:hypothetical protein